MSSIKLRSISTLHNHHVHLNEGFTFSITGEHAPGKDYASHDGRHGYGEFASKEIALAEIKRLCDQAAIEEGVPRLTLKMVDEAGNLFELNGIHRGNGRLLTTPKLDNYKPDKVYPDVHWIVQAIEEWNRLRARSEEIATLLHPLQIRPGYYGIDSVVRLVSKLRDIGEKHAEMSKAAKRTTYRRHKLVEAE